MSEQRRRGRPPHGITDVLRARTWYSAVRMRSNGASDYALEKRFTAAPLSDEQPWVSTGSWRAYRRGRVPEPAFADRVEQVFPGTRVWLKLPFWEIVRVPAPSLARVRSLIAHLRTDIAELLFLNPGVYGDRLERRPTVAETFRELDRQSDIEALTACMGLIREAEFQGNEYQHFQGAITALRIFLRLAKSHPLADTAPAILDYLNLCFFSAPYQHVPRQGPASGGIDLTAEISIRNSIVLMLEDFGVLPPDRAKQRACLYLADLYGLGQAARELDDLYRTAGWRAAKAAPIVRWFVRRLRSFKLTVSCLD